MKEIGQKIERDLVVYDIESTGLDLNLDQVLQFHGTRIQKKTGKTKELTFLCCPTVPIHPKASAVNGYTEEKLKGKPKFSHFAKEVLEFFKDADISGYNNNKFDNVILSRQMQENGVPDFLKDRLSFDAYEVYLSHLNKKLGGAVEFYTGKKAEDLHDAKNDVGFTLLVVNEQLKKENATPSEVIAKLAEKQKEKDSDISRYIVKEGEDWVINFSKNKGQKLSQVDSSFLRWVLAKEFPKELKDIIRPYSK